MEKERTRLYLLLIVGAILLAYANSFSGAILFDDVLHIFQNPSIKSLHQAGQLLSDTSRPVVALTWAINYRLGGLNVWGYHLLNVLIHGLAALTLLGIVRRTLKNRRLPERTRAEADPLALIITLLWALHPLQTQSVTYLVQRGESLMGLFYLLSLYGLIRSAESARPRLWQAGVVLSNAFGMASKPVMVTAPLILLWYDRLFLAGSWRELFRRRAALYLGLIAGWGLLFLILRQRFSEYETNAGFWMGTVTPYRYALTQPQVILHYLRLCFWPHPLILDYEWPIAQGIREVWPSLALLAAGAGLLLWKFRRRPEVLFLGGWFFLILAPTSSFIPIADAAFEHRMYLPLAAVACGAVLAARRRSLGIGIALGVLIALGITTALRSRDYDSLPRMWAEVLKHRPHSVRAHINLGAAMNMLGNFEEAERLLRRAVELKPDSAEAHGNLGFALARLNSIDQMRTEYREALGLQPTPSGASKTSTRRASAAQLQEAEAEYREALRLEPQLASMHSGLAAVLERSGRMEEAETEYRETLRLDPHRAGGHVNLGLLCQRKGDLQQALQEYRAAVQLDPGNPIAQSNVGTVLIQMGRWAEATPWFIRAIRTDPDCVEAWTNLGAVYQHQGELHKSITCYSKALEIRPEDRQARTNLRSALSALRRAEKNIRSP